MSTQEWQIYRGILPRDIGMLGAMPMYSVSHDAWYLRPEGQLQSLRMPASDSDPTLGATGDAQATAQVLLDYLTVHGVPSVHSCLPIVKSFQNAWNATTTTPSVLSVDGRYNAATATALAVTLSANVPAPNDGGYVGMIVFPGLGRVDTQLGDATQDGLDLTMQDRAGTLLSDFNGGAITSAPNGDVTNFQIAWNNSTPGKNMTLAVDGKYGPLTAQALGKALAWVGPNGNVVGGTAPNGFNYGGGGGGGGSNPNPNPTPPGNNTQSVTVAPTSSNSTAAWILGGALVAAAGIAGYAWYHKGGGKAMLTRRRARHALPRARARRRRMR